MERGLQNNKETLKESREVKFNNGGMKEYIQLHTKEQFKEVMKQYKKEWKSYMWNYFKENTCYLPKENCFVDLKTLRNN